MKESDKLSFVFNCGIYSSSINYYGIILRLSLCSEMHQVHQQEAGAHHLVYTVLTEINIKYELG